PYGSTDVLTLEDGTPENIVRIVKEWRLSQGLP
ncbi:bacteriocin immunity protein, partial [Vibrio parahaemolyticus]|nr:bacteriocin immunity protein [Vibrio parahaemolyticus]EJG0389186.1 bacteriocin immunity protein [Vibrio parahaemolyticus]